MNKVKTDVDVVYEKMNDERLRFTDRLVDEIIDYTIQDIELSESDVKDLAIFMVVGLVISVVYVLLANLLDTTVKSAEDIEKELEISVLVSIPALRDESKISKGGVY